MEALLRRRKRAPVYRVLKGVACFFLLGGTIFLSTNAQAREAFFGWLSEQIGGTVDYRFHNDVSEATHRYRLSEIPSGYWETDRYEAETTGDELYENEAGEYLSFSYQYVTEDTESMLSLFFVDEMEQKTVSINGTPADYYFDNTGTHSNTLVWTDPETKALLDFVRLLRRRYFDIYGRKRHSRRKIIFSEKFSNLVSQITSLIRYSS